MTRSNTSKSTRRLDAKPEQAAIRERLQRHWRPRLKDAEARKLIQEAMLQAIAWAEPRQDLHVIAALRRLMDGQAVDFYTFKPGEYVEHASEASGYFFVVQEGCLEVTVDNKVVGTLTHGSTFGGDGLLWGGKSVGTVTVTEEAGLWAISGPNFQQLLRQTLEEQAAENSKFLQSIATFEGLPAKQLDLLSYAVHEELVPPGIAVVTKGDSTTDMYFVKKGALRVVDGAPNGTADNGSTELARIGAGHTFGERALLYGEPRVASVITIEQCELLRIRAEKLHEALGSDLRTYLERCLMLSGLRDSLAYAQFDTEQHSLIIQAMEVQDCAANVEVATLVRGDFRLLIVLGGELRRGQEAALCRGKRLEDHLGDLVAGPNGARIGVLTRQGFVKALAPHVVGSGEQADEYAKKMLLVKKVPLFRHLSQEHTEKLVTALKLRRYNKDDTVIEQGDVGDALFVIAHGEVTVTISGHLIRTQGRNACFGERALLFDEKRTATVEVSSREAEIWTIDKATFGQIVKGMMREELMHRIALQDTKVTLQDLRHKKVIGAGAFSTVHMAEHKRTKVRYALKTVKKQNGLMPLEMKNECSILLENDHPFILYMVKTFETATRVCMLTELVTGGDLHSAIRMIPTVLSKPQAQFYTGSLVITIEALWDRNVVYRDLKPENVMLDAQGYLKLVDFGISKKLGDAQSRTFTMVGTPHYMAPEVMRGRGYGAVVDLWSLGVMLFEFVCGCLPFADDLDNPTEVCTAVLKDPLAFPRGFRDKDGKDLIKALLCRQPERRLGAGGLSQVKESPYFRLNDRCHPDMLFDKVMGRELDPPLVPCGEKYCDQEDAEACTLSDMEELFPATQQVIPEPATPEARQQPHVANAREKECAASLRDVQLRPARTFWQKVLCCS